MCKPAVKRAHGGDSALNSQPCEGATAAMRIPAEQLLRAGSARQAVPDLIEDFP